MSIKRHRWNAVIEPRRQPAIPADVERLRADLPNAAPDDVVNVGWINGNPVHQTAEDFRSEINGMDSAQSTSEAAHR